MQPAPLVSVADYAALENESEARHELVAGQIVAMAGASPRHNAIALNIAAELRRLLRGRNCRPYGSDQRVLVEATHLDTYPDVSVICGEINRSSDDERAATNPTLLVEVLSPSTERYDRGAKWQHYQRIPSLREYLLVSVVDTRVERFFLGGDGVWRYELVANPEAFVALDSLAVRLHLAEVYADLPEP